MRNKLVIYIFSLAVVLLFSTCKKTEKEIVDHKKEMRLFVQNISSYARNLKNGFIVIPQNGHQLLTTNGKPDGVLSYGYITAIDGVGREDLFYGYDKDNKPTPADATTEMNSFLTIAKTAGKKVLVTDYCSTLSLMDDSYLLNSSLGYVSFAADRRDLDNIPRFPNKPFNENADTVKNASDVKNFLYLINPETYHDKTTFISALQNTNFDLLIIDLYFDEVPLTADDIHALQVKKNGAPRKVICYMSIGEAEDYRYYWQPFWKGNPPKFLEGPNPEWEGNYRVKYWKKEWQNIIYGNNYSYLKKIIEADFDGVYLDVIDAFEYFEIKD